MGNMNLHVASNCDYNHGAIIRISWVQTRTNAVAPK